MLRLLDVQPGHRVLEVGTGSGHSTALLAHLAGGAGQVRPGGVIVAPLRRRTAQVVRFRVVSAQQVSEERQLAAGFIPLTARPLRPWEDD